MLRCRKHLPHGRSCSTRMPVCKTLVVVVTRNTVSLHARCVAYHRYGILRGSLRSFASHPPTSRPAVSAKMPSGCRLNALSYFKDENSRKSRYL
ncbi:hypothetical protein POSPLADRAFT_1065869 [Postia placenta MAD-698-R-SB12]|uniref:Uncharacterized protein n=1 Tax=Postia placenta MAD-698-R-SB12 TaxID=670580 RepID=A0A1X6N299_9APHY|nr:hypothetical protein POSPLADRAFT_1065869 [Postia placenta MAD-698-R-SB12]OSX62728.1 hypothetical protein POSPLADRAFT_1065869 [Postia placenta MAD-698-R-SB12]